MTRSSAPAVSLALLPCPQRSDRLIQWEVLVQSGTKAVQAGHPEMALFSCHQGHVDPFRQRLGPDRHDLAGNTRGEVQRQPQ